MAATIEIKLARVLPFLTMTFAYRSSMVDRGSKATRHPFGFIMARASVSIVLLSSEVSDGHLKRIMTSKRLFLAI